MEEAWEGLSKGPGCVLEAGWGCCVDKLEEHREGGLPGGAAVATEESQEDEGRAE